MASQQPIFRTIDVGHDQPITLGEPLSADVRALMDPQDPAATELEMQPGHFGQAASITVDLSAADMTVQEIEFTYDSAEPNYDTLLQDYTEMLGPPHETGTVNDAQRSATWSDSFTTFILWEREMGGTVNSGSTLLNNGTPGA